MDGEDIQELSPRPLQCLQIKEMKSVTETLEKECDRSRARRGRHLSRQLYMVDKREVKDDAEVCQ